MTMRGVSVSSTCNSKNDDQDMNPCTSSSAQNSTVAASNDQVTVNKALDIPQSCGVTCQDDSSVKYSCKKGRGLMLSNKLLAIYDKNWLLFYDFSDLTKVFLICQVKALEIDLVSMSVIQQRESKMENKHSIVVFGRGHDRDQYGQFKYLQFMQFDIRVIYTEQRHIDSVRSHKIYYFSQEITRDTILFNRESLSKVLYNDQVLKNAKNESIIAIIIEKTIFILNANKKTFVKSPQVTSYCFAFFAFNFAFVPFNILYTVILIATYKH